MEKVRFLRFNNIEPHQYAATLEVLSVSGVNTLAIFAGITPPACLIPKQAVIDEVVNRENCLKDNVSIIRYETVPRGGAHWKDTGSFKGQFLMDRKPELHRREQTIRESASNALLDSYRALGVNAEHPVHSNDVVFQGWKIGTASQYAHPKMAVFSWSAVVDFNYDLAEKYVRSKKPMREWVLPVRSVVPDISMDKIVAAVRSAFDRLPIELADETLTRQEEESVQSLQAKYHSERWNVHGEYMV
jgi:lipoate-protein ligase A